MQDVKKVLATIKDPKDLITRLRQRLDNTPASSRGWYLLGRLYLSQNELQQAKTSFKKAITLNPENDTARVSYVQVLLLLNHQQFNDDMTAQLHLLLKKIQNNRMPWRCLPLKPIRKRRLATPSCIGNNC